MPNLKISKYENEIIKDLQELIKIQSLEGTEKPNMPFGEKTNEALEFVLNKGKDFGFKTKNVDGYTGYVEAGKGSHMIGILCHVDVVPAGEGWKHPPFEGIIEDGKIFGRGSVDDKGPIISILYSMKMLEENNLIGEDNKIRLILGTAEETSWGGIKHYLKSEEIPDVSFTPDANFPVICGEKGLLDFDLKMNFTNKSNENSISVLEITGGESRNSVPSKCSAILSVPTDKKQHLKEKIQDFNNTYDCKIKAKYNDKNVEIQSIGKTAHGANPEEGINAISYMIQFLNSLDLSNNDITIFIKEYCELVGLEYNGESLGCDFKDDISGKSTLNIGTIELDNKSVLLKCNLRYPISIDYNSVIDSINNSLKSSPLKYFEFEHIEPIYFSKEDELIKIMMKAYREVTGDFESQPIVIGGATYARALPNTVAFGPVFPWQKELAHQINEYISIDDLMKITEIYTKALYLLCNN
jgi:succinyl-diaminopimelate desuccinylase